MVLRIPHTRSYLTAVITAASVLAMRTSKLGKANAAKIIHLVPEWEPRQPEFNFYALRYNIGLAKSSFVFFCKMALVVFSCV